MREFSLKGAGINHRAIAGAERGQQFEDAIAVLGKLQGLSDPANPAIGGATQHDRTGNALALAQVARQRPALQRRHQPAAPGHQKQAGKHGKVGQRQALEPAADPLAVGQQKRQTRQND